MFSRRWGPGSPLGGDGSPSEVLQLDAAGAAGAPSHQVLLRSRLASRGTGLRAPVPWPGSSAGLTCISRSHVRALQLLHHLPGGVTGTFLPKAEGGSSLGVSPERFSDLPRVTQKIEDKRQDWNSGYRVPRSEHALAGPQLPRSCGLRLPGRHLSNDHHGSP